MKIDSRTYPNPDDSSYHIPPGEYCCIINNVLPGFKTKNQGEDCWKIEGEVINGQHIGKKWQDRWIFNSQNSNTQKRQVLIQHRVGGFAKVFEGDIEPEDFIGREVYVTFEDNFYNGKTYHKVTFNGYRAVEQEIDIEIAEEEKRLVEKQDISSDEIPF